ncbi:hypothetical protein CS542_02565 [Pedobacter sp. IW39]|nr:hypothetical protein CS542_02565 [Pedobacter sp. IW39]
MVISRVTGNEATVDRTHRCCWLKYFSDFNLYSRKTTGYLCFLLQYLKSFAALKHRHVSC